MHLRSFVAKLLLAAFVVTGVCGLGATMVAPMQHETGCPFALGNTSVCDAALAHLTHWQSAFAAVLAELLIVVAFMAVSFFSSSFSLGTQDYSRYRTSALAPIRPSLFQELFSKGILHRKEPYIGV